jgi:hypothetical protein
VSDPQSSLNNHHRDTLRKILEHPSSGNVEWRQVISLVEAVGSAVHEPNGKVRLTVGPETQVVTPPRHKDVDTHLLVELRRMLLDAGLGPDSG